MRKLTICLIAFAVAFSICGIAFRSVIAANGRAAQTAQEELEQMPVYSGMRGVHDGELY